MPEAEPSTLLLSEPHDGQQILEHEVFWRDHYNWLEEEGYQLRPRYRPDWVASWKGTQRSALLCEDGCIASHPVLLDAVRIKDGAIVMLRRADSSSVSDELKIGRIFSSDPVRSDPRNHCVPVYATLKIPEDEGNVIVVMPFLIPWEKPKFSTFGEAIDFFSQIFEGLQFMHSLHVAHNDVKDNNIMMDWSPLYDAPPHPINRLRKRDWSGTAKSHERTERPAKYYFIDYDLSEQYLPENGPALHVPGYGGDQSVPEFKKGEPVNPFAVDVYCMGNMIRSVFIAGDMFNEPKRGFEFMLDLIADMTQGDPSKRPNMDEVVTRFETIKRGLKPWKLRSRIVSKREGVVSRVFRAPLHWSRQMVYVAKRTPAIPAA